MKSDSTLKWTSLPGSDDITRVVLENGVTVLVRANEDSPSVRLTGYVSAGSVFDPRDRLGLSQFTALALMHGTQSRGFQEIHDTLESIGASLGFGASVHTASFGGQSLAEDLPVLLRMLSECLRQPSFPDDQLEKLRAQLLTGLAIRSQRTEEMASLVFEQNLFRDHPYGYPVDGFSETVQNITRQDILTFHNRYYGPQGMVVVVVGGISPQEVVEQVRAVLGDWRNAQQHLPEELPNPSALYGPVRQHIVLPEKSQSDLVMGALGPARNSADYLPASLGNSILGKFGMMGRIGDVVREQSGLAYYASANLNASLAGGSWEVSAGVNPTNLQKAIDLIIKEIRRFVEEPVTAQELEDNKSYFIGRLPLLMESNAGVAGTLMNIERFNLGLDYYRMYPEEVQQVSAEQVLETARNYLDPDRLVICSAGTAFDNGYKDA